MHSSHEVPIRFSLALRCCPTLKLNCLEVHVDSKEKSVKVLDCEFLVQ